MSLSCVRWINGDTGEIKEHPFSGVDREYVEHGSHPLFAELEEVRMEWQATALDLALALVPDLVVEIDRARIMKKSIEIKVRVLEEPQESSWEHIDQAEIQERERQEEADRAERDLAESAKSTKE